MKAWTQEGAALLLLVCACDGDLPSYNEIEGLRVLALSASAPWISPGQGSEISALVVSDVPVTYSWTWCPLLQSAEQRFDCALPQTELPQGWPSYSLGSRPTAIFTAPTEPAIRTLCESLDLPCEQTLQINVRLEVNDGEQTIESLRTLQLVLQGERWNQNPEVEAVRATATATTLSTTTPALMAAGQEVPLSLELVEGSAELLSDGTKERLFVSWFVDQGELEAGRTVANGLGDGLQNLWTLPQMGEAEARLYVVVRDGRGGTSWHQSALRMETQP